MISQMFHSVQEYYITYMTTTSTMVTGNSAESGGTHDHVQAAVRPYHFEPVRKHVMGRTHSE